MATGASSFVAALVAEATREIEGDSNVANSLLKGKSSDSCKSENAAFDGLARFFS